VRNTEKSSVTKEKGGSLDKIKKKKKGHEKKISEEEKFI